MSQVLVIFGATGQQGSSVVNHVLNDPELSQKYKIRAITRDPTSEKAKQLQIKVEVVQADVTDRASLEKALTGAHTIFAMTTPSFGPDALEVEFNNGKTIADVAVEKGVKYLIFSTLPSVTEISGGKYTKVTPFDAKAKVEQYIRSLTIKSAFYSPGFFMENFASQPFWTPRKRPNGTLAISFHISGKTRLPMFDSVGDGGKFIGAILAEPERFEGKTLCAGQGLYSLEEIAAAMTKSSGKEVVYEQVTANEFKESLPFAADLFFEAYSFEEEFGGYYGPDTEKLVAWAAENARGRLSTLDEYFEAHPLTFDS